MSARSRVIGFGSALVLVIAGVVGGVAFGGTFGQVLALVLVSLGGVLATALVFYEVGLSEDHERARDAAETRTRGRGAAEKRTQGRDAAEKRTRVRDAAAEREGERRRASRPGSHLQRRRGQRRRLDQ